MTWKISAVLVAGVFLAGCDDGGGGSGGAGGSGGEGGATTTTTTATNEGGGGGGQGGAGGQSAGGECGGIGGLTCGADEYCNYGDNSCGSTDSLGTCTPRPVTCSDIYQPTCACNGTVYSNECDANAVGQDASGLGGCPVPAGTFACGQTFCANGQQYCQRAISDVGGEPDSYVCVSLPANCMACDCLANEPCGASCEESPSGGLTVTCLGG